jgi:hypothetical protein
MEKLSFQMQALDNMSHDHYQIGEELLSDTDPFRQLVTNTISDVARNGHLVFKSNGAELIIRGRLFLIQVYANQLDVVGRRAPIICCGEFDKTTNSPDIIKAISAFAEKIGVTARADHLDVIGTVLVGEVLDAKDKANKLHSLKIGTAVLAGIGALLVGIHRITR